ncbi:fimbrial protein [Kluyvera genomosp. 1]|uniref:fimbrial protein n=1 Tax=Kluyvera genomosp. 1 TaxID=2774053 RepID=UPI00068E0D29|nr:fimbrial protein [Kluyvera genomosp. 1]
MRRNYRFVCSLILLAAAISSPRVWAENCSNTVGDMTINTQNIQYLPSLPVNSQMSHSMADNGSGIRFTCDLQAPAAGWKRLVYQQIDTNGAATAINGVHIFPTKLDGLGYSLGFQCNGGAVHYIDGSTSPAGNQSATICDSADMPTLLSQKEIVIKAYVTFYKTGEIQLSGGNHANVDAQPQVGQLFMDLTSATGNGTTTTQPTFLGLSALNVDIGASGSCLVTTPTINVALGSVNKSAFKGVNTTGGSAQNFAIPVYCTQPTDVRIGFFGLEVGAGFPDTLALTRLSGAASGVGVKLSYGSNDAPAPAAGTAVKINEATNLPLLKKVTASNAASAERINFTAQYVQTESAVGAGIANSMATFTLVYN